MKEIRTSSEERDLGVLFDDDLKFRKHMSNCINKANKITGLIRRTFLHIGVRQFRKLYKTLVRPHLEYCNIVWAPYLIKDIQAIERAQKRATKLVWCVRDLPYHERLKILKIPSLSYRRLRGDIIQVWKLLNGKDNIDFEKFFEKRSTDIHQIRGHSQHLQMKKSVREMRRNFFSCRAIAPWNALPEEIISSPTIDTLKNRFDKLMKNHYHIIVPENRSWSQVIEGVKKDNESCNS